MKDSYDCDCGVCSICNGLRKPGGPLKSTLERVDGISRFYETLWIERGTDNNIKQVYDWNFDPVDKTMLANSFIVVGAIGGFTYKGEFIAMENAIEKGIERASSLQRNRKHSSNKPFTKQQTE